MQASCHVELTPWSDDLSRDTNKGSEHSELFRDCEFHDYEKSHSEVELVKSCELEKGLS